MLSSIISAVIIWSLAARAIEITPCASETTTFNDDCFTCQPIDYYTYGFLGWYTHYINRVCFQRTKYGYRCVYQGTDYNITNQYFTGRQNVNQRVDTVNSPQVGQCFYANNGTYHPQVTLFDGKTVKKSWSRCPYTAPRNQKCLDRKVKIEQDKVDARYYNGDKIESDECQKCPKRSESNSVNVTFPKSETMACKYTDKAGKTFECDYDSTTGKLTTSPNTKKCADQAQAGSLLCRENKAARDKARREEEEYRKRIEEERRHAGPHPGYESLLDEDILAYCQFCKDRLDGGSIFEGVTPCEAHIYDEYDCEARLID